LFFSFSFSLEWINCTRGFIVIFPHMHIIYFDQIHSSITLFCFFLVF
jgi:hypothetical protein